MSEEVDSFAEQMGDDIIQEFDKWIRPELAKIIGWPTVEKLKNVEFDATFQVGANMLFLERSHTVKRRGATFFFRLCQGTKEHHVVRSKWQYEVKFDEPKEEWNK